MAVTVESAVASAVAALIDLNIQLWTMIWTNKLTNKHYREAVLILLYNLPETKNAEGYEYSIKGCQQNQNMSEKNAFIIHTKQVITILRQQ